MMDAAVINANGDVHNVIIVEDLESFDPGADLRLEPIPDGLRVSPGDTFRDGAFVIRAPDPLEINETLVQYLARRRWEVEVGGITVGGAPMATDDRAKLMILGKRTKAKEDPSGVTRWKVNAEEFAWIPNTAIIAVADAVEAHVQACFDAEAEILARIHPGEITTKAEIDAELAKITRAY